MGQLDPRLLGHRLEVGEPLLGAAVDGLAHGFLVAVNTQVGIYRRQLSLSMAKYSRRGGLPGPGHHPRPVHRRLLFVGRGRAAGAAARAGFRRRAPGGRCSTGGRWPGPARPGATRPGVASHASRHLLAQALDHLHVLPDGRDDLAPVLVGDALLHEAPRRCRGSAPTRGRARPTDRSGGAAAC